MLFKEGDGLRLALFGNGEGVLFEAGDGRAFVVRDQYIHQDRLAVDAEGGLRRDGLGLIALSNQRDDG